MTWYLIQTKPRSEKLALENLSNQGYECYLPMLKAQKVINNQIEVQKVPLFPRYLFINLDLESKSWAPIRSTRGVSNLVKFGQTPAKVHDELVSHIYSREHSLDFIIQPMYQKGQTLKIVDGPFSGFESVYQGMDPEMRVLVLIEFMSKPLILSVELNQIKK